MNQHTFGQLVGSDGFIELKIHLLDGFLPIAGMPLLRYLSQDVGGFPGRVGWDRLFLQLTFKGSLQFGDGTVHLPRNHAEADDDDHDEHRQHYQRIQRLLHHGHDHNIARHPYHIEEMPAPIGGTDFSSVNPVLVSLVGGREKVNSRLNPCADRLRVHRLRTDRASVVGEHHELLQAVIVFKQGGVQLFAVQQEIDSAVKTHVRHV